MDLRSVLQPDDLFVSYLMADEIMVAVGDARGVAAVEYLETGPAREAVAEFEWRVSEERSFRHFIRERVVDAIRPAPQVESQPLSSLVSKVAVAVVPPSLVDAARRGEHRRLVVFPDGLLNGLPFPLLLATLAPDLEDGFPGGVVYAPSASSYVYCCHKRLRGLPAKAAVLIGDRHDRALEREAAWVVAVLPCDTEVVDERADLARLLPEVELLYITSHGTAPAGAAGRESAADEAEWRILFDGSAMGPRDFYQETIQLRSGAVVVVSACSVGRLMPGVAHELLGLVRAILYAGAATVLAPRWPVLYATAEAVLGGTIERVYHRGSSFAAALKAALDGASRDPKLNRLLAGPEAAPWFWGPFALYGCGD